jgi:hypothetical protein
VVAQLFNQRDEVCSCAVEGFRKIYVTDVHAL